MRRRRLLLWVGAVGLLGLGGLLVVLLTMPLCFPEPVPGHLPARECLERIPPDAPDGDTVIALEGFGFKATSIVVEESGWVTYRYQRDGDRATVTFVSGPDGLVYDREVGGTGLGGILDRLRRSLPW